MKLKGFKMLNFRSLLIDNNYKSFCIEFNSAILIGDDHLYGYGYGSSEYDRNDKFGDNQGPFLFHDQIGYGLGGHLDGDGRSCCYEMSLEEANA